MRNRFYLLLALLIVTVTVQAQFTALNGPVGGDIRDLERASNGTLYTITGNTLYQSINNGSSWTKTTITTPVTGVSFEDIMISPTGKFYAVTYNEVYTSADATNWTKVNTTQFYGMLRIRRIGPDGFIMIYGWNGMWISKDDGVNFTQILANNSIVDPYSGWSVTSNSAGDLFAGTYEGIKRYLYPGTSGTYDAANWTIVYPMTDVQHINLGADAADNIYASTLAFGGGTYPRLIGRSLAANKGAVGTWTSLLRSGINNNGNDWRGYWAFSGSTVYFFNDGDGRKIYSTNSGFTTTTYNLASAVTAINSTLVTVPSTVSAKEGDQISGLGIPTETYISEIISATQFYMSNNATASGTVTLTGTTLSTPWSTIDGPSAKYGSAMKNTLFISGSNYLIGTEGAGILTTTNSGTSFSLTSNGINSGNGFDIAVANTTGRIIYINSNSSKGYWTSTDNGTTWSFVELPTFFRKVVKLASGKIILYGNSVYSSSDNGATFTEVYPQYLQDL
jgi:roadblock/LC7 domain-containing protein